MTNYATEITSEVIAIGEMHLEGNIIPHNWYQHIKFDNGKVDLISITLLAEIVYWYRPTYIRDEITGSVVSIKKKFKNDILQKHKKCLADQFGLTERQVQESLARLEKLGLITREYRTINQNIYDSSVRVSNVLFIRIHPEKIKEITFGGYRYDVQTSDPQRSKVKAPTPERQTNTYTTTKNTTENTNTPPNPQRRNSANAESVGVSSSSSSKSKENKEKDSFGEHGNCKLTPEEHNKLLVKFGQDELSYWIETIDLEAEKTGVAKFNKKYKSHYATILSWKRMREEKGRSNDSNIAPHRRNSKLLTPADGKPSTYKRKEL